MTCNWRDLCPVVDCDRLMIVMTKFFLFVIFLYILIIKYCFSVETLSIKQTLNSKISIDVYHLTVTHIFCSIVGPVNPGPRAV